MGINNKSLVLLGIRGVPASHGGFETFAEHLCLYLHRQGWEVTVYCQENGKGSTYSTEWNGVRRIHIPIENEGALGTIVFDLKSIIHSLRFDAVFLTLGYNTAVFNLLHRIARKHNIINMDGIEWKRQKWGMAAKFWFWLNERFGCWFGTHLVADHPCLQEHLSTRVASGKITMIPYGAVRVAQSELSYLEEFGVEPGQYAVLIARPEPENSILELVRAFSSKQRNAKFVVLGNFDATKNDYHRKVFEAASDEVIFPGAIYDSDKIGALRFFACCYVHGHQVGGTNPSLVEALGAGNAVLAHDNQYNRWVAKDGAVYFDSEESASLYFDKLLTDGAFVARLKERSINNFTMNFQWPAILHQYEVLLTEWL